MAVGAPQAGGEIHEERFMKRKEKKETKRKRRGSRVAVGAPQAGGEIRERKRRKKEEERKEREKKEKRKRKEREKKEKRKRKEKKRVSSGCGSSPQAGGERDVNSEYIL